MHSSGAPEPDIRPLAAVMARLRDPNHGCPWDLEQDFRSIAPYTIEEAYEVADAIERGDLDALREELGDLALQVVYHSQIAAEAGAFTLSDVLREIAAKMIRRHPHVFGDTEVADAAAQTHAWESLKAAEKPRAHALDGVALGLPALLRAEKLQKRAARVGFDWPDATGPRAKIDEELREVDAAADDASRTEELGDLLFAVVNYARHCGIDAEAALRAANSKFERRFAAMEAAAGADFATLSLDEKEGYWMAAKRNAAQT